MLSLLFSVLVAQAQTSTINYIGDSQSASSIGMLAKLRPVLQTHQFRLVNGRAICGATIDDYLKGGVLSRCGGKNLTYMDLENGVLTFPLGKGSSVQIGELAATADATVIELGDNHLGNPEGAGPLAQKLARQILKQGKRCVWIGPAAVPVEPKTVESGGQTIDCVDRFQKKQQVSRSIQKAFADPKFSSEFGGQTCYFVDSFTPTSKVNIQSPDCLHYSNYETWAGEIRKDLIQALSESTTSFSSVRAKSR